MAFYGGINVQVSEEKSLQSDNSVSELKRVLSLLYENCNCKNRVSISLVIVYLFAHWYIDVMCAVVKSVRSIQADISSRLCL